MNSRNYLIIAVVCIAVLTSCKKEESNAKPIKDPEPLEHPLLKVGNKWVYETVWVDSTGKETFSGDIDSITIVSDTMVNGKKWFKSHFKGPFYFRRTRLIILYRDSAGILVNNFGERVLDKYKKGQKSTKKYYHRNKLIEMANSFVKPNDTTVSVPAGTFNVTNIETKIKAFGDNGMTGTHTNYEWYSEELGETISSTYTYAYSILFGHKGYFNRRLIRYKVQ
jgi:hypothetical protein